MHSGSFSGVLRGLNPSCRIPHPYLRGRKKNGETDIEKNRPGRETQGHMSTYACTHIQRETKKQTLSLKKRKVFFENSELYPVEWTRGAGVSELERCGQEGNKETIGSHPQKPKKCGGIVQNVAHTECAAECASWEPLEFSRAVVALQSIHSRLWLDAGY